jgi:uncharacterized protein
MKLLGASVDLYTMGPAFLCDGMAGHLARWLRLMGFDAEYAGSLLTDNEILARMAASPRVLLTRDAQLFDRARRRGHVAVRVVEAPLEDEIAQALREGGATLDEGRWFTRCTTCNGALEGVPRDAVRGQVPENVALGTVDFSRCALCGQVYWPGTHVEPIRATLAAVARRLPP